MPILIYYLIICHYLPEFSTPSTTQVLAKCDTQQARTRNDEKLMIAKIAHF